MQQSVDAADTRPAGRVLEHEQKTNPAAVQRALPSMDVPTEGQSLLQGINTQHSILVKRGSFGDVDDVTSQNDHNRKRWQSLPKPYYTVKNELLRQGCC